MHPQRLNEVMVMSDFEDKEYRAMFAEARRKRNMAIGRRPSRMFVFLALYILVRTYVWYERIQTKRGKRRVYIVEVKRVRES
jgi:hypothetical protein